MSGLTGLTGVEQRLLALFDSPAYLVTAVLVAVGVGAAHAVAPGHGKAITAAYLVGTHGRYRHAAALGGIVAAMHTVSVLVLAGMWVALTVTATTGTQKVSAWLQLLAGAVVVAVGIRLLRGGGHDDHHPHDFHRAVGAPTGSRRTPADDSPGHGFPGHHFSGYGHGSHGHGSHDHGSHGSHDHGSHGSHGHGSHGHGSHGHGSHDHGSHGSHHHGCHHHDAHGTVDPWSRRGLVALGLSGGLLPSPSAFLVLVSGLLTGRAAYALLLVAAFGLGMAATLTAVGAASLRGQSLLESRAARSRRARAAAAWLPRLASVGVVVGGTAYAGSAAGALLQG